MVRRLLLVEDHADTREILANLLRRWGFEVDTADSVQRALDLLVEPFDAIIADIGLPDGTGYAVISEAKQRRKAVLGIALSAYGSPSDIQVGKLAGFDHHLTKPFDCERIRSLLTGADRAHAGEPDEKLKTSHRRLTAREREVLQLIAKGKSNRAVAETLGISVRTAETHRANILRKLKLDSVANLVRYAVRSKVVDA